MFTYDVADVERIKPERSDSPAEKKNFYSEMNYFWNSLPVNLSILE